LKCYDSISDGGVQAPSLLTLSRACLGKTLCVPPAVPVEHRPAHQLTVPTHATHRTRVALANVAEAGGALESDRYMYTILDSLVLILELHRHSAQNGKIFLSQCAFTLCVPGEGLTEQPPPCAQKCLAGRSTRAASYRECHATRRHARTLSSARLCSSR
jgi:hypothetical protein